MKKRRQMTAMLSSMRASAPTLAVGEMSELDGDYGVSSLALSGVVGGLPPRELSISGAPPSADTPTLDAPIAIPYVGEHAVDRIGRGFFTCKGENELSLPFERQDLTEGEELIVSLDLGADYSGRVTLSLGEQRMRREIFGLLGERYDFRFTFRSGELEPLVFSSSSDATLRLSLRGARDEGEALAVTLLATDKEQKRLSYTRILLPTPLYYLPLGGENALYLPDRRERVELDAAEITQETAISLLEGSRDAYAPAFSLHPFGAGRGSGRVLVSHGIPVLDDAGVIAGEKEGFAVHEEDRTRLTVSLSYDRLSRSVSSIVGTRRDHNTGGDPDAPVTYDFFPWADLPFGITDEDGETLLFRLAEPLRRVGDYADTLLLNVGCRLALRITRIGCLTLTGNEDLSMVTTSAGLRFTYTYAGGQRTNAANSIPQLCTHADVSSHTALIAPSETDGMTAYLDGYRLSIALDPSRPYAASLRRFREFLMSEAAAGRPFTYYYPLAEPRYELIALEGWDSASLEGQTPVYPSLTPIEGRDGDLLGGLARLWIASQSPSLRVLYPLPTPENRAVTASPPRLLMPYGDGRIAAVGQGKPIQISLSAYLYPSEIDPSSQPAAKGGETK